MISKQRLKELIGQGATIYSKHRSYKLKNEKVNNTDFWYRTISEIKDNKFHYVYEDSDYYEDFDHLIALEELFETKEEAEFALRYKRIPRTEYLDLPTWDEFTKERDMEEFGFYSKYHKYTTLKVISDKYLAVEDIWERYYTGELTKKNYISACLLCKKLFLGENDDK